MKRAIHAGKSFFAPTTLTAIIAIAISFAFLSCSGDDGGGDGESSSSSGGKSSSSTAALACGEWETKTPATCESAGSKTRSCDGDSTETEALPKLSWGSWTTTKAATCAAKGERFRSCPGDASPAQTEEIAILEWEQTIAPTCEAAGERKKCGASDTEPVDQLKWSDWRTKVEPTCSEAGVRTRTCGGQTESEDIPKLSGPSCQSPSSETVTIGSQVWMAKNSDIEVPGSECYDEEPENCAKYGRLYSWEAAKKACPSGFRLPSKEDWDALAAFIESDKGCSDCDALHLKAASGWYDWGGNPSDNGLDSYDFAALPGGYGYPDGYFYSAGRSGLWWSASEIGSDVAYIRDVYYDYEGAYWYTDDKTNMYSVRCLQD